MSFLGSILKVSSAPEGQGYIPFLPDEIASVVPLPEALAVLVAEFASDVFGSRQWRDCFGALPVTLPSLEDLRKRVVESGKKTAKPLEEMSREECANLVGELGQEEVPSPPQALHECLNHPVHAGDPLAGLTCAVTFIPEYIRKEGRVLAVTSRTLGFELSPNLRLNNPDYVLTKVLTPKDAESTQPSCYFLLELTSKAKKQKAPDFSRQMKNWGNGDWELPEARNFIAALFCRYALRGELLHGYSVPTYTFGQGLSRNGSFMVFGRSYWGATSILIDLNNGRERGAAGSKKFPV